MNREDANTRAEQPRDPVAAADETAVSALIAVLEACEDGEKGYRAAATDVLDRGYQLIFAHYADERAGFTRVLAESVRALGAVPTRDGSERGALHRDWLELKSALSRGNARAVLTECRRGEDAALETYRTALHADLPPDVREVVQEQYESVKRARAEMSTLEQAAD